MVLLARLIGAVRSARTRSAAPVETVRPVKRGASGFVVLLVLIAGIFVGVRGLDLFGLPSLHNPFTSETKDRTSPTLLKALSDLSRYDAASGDFEVLVDVQHDIAHVPTVLKGDRTLFQAQGSVDAYVEFGGLTEGAIVTSADGKSVTVTLPHAALTSPNIDPKQSKVISQDRGLLDRISSVFEDNSVDQQELYIAAQDKMAAAAKEGGLQQKAEDNTRTMLTKMLTQLGYDKVTVNFETEVRP